MQSQQSRPRAFTLIEALVTISALAVLVGGSVMLISNVRGGVEGQKLRKDVTRLNAAVSVYIANGGDLDGVTAPVDILNKVKSVATGANTRQIVGLKGSALDHRVVPVMLTPTETASSLERAIWDPGTSRFVIANTGDNGVKAFAIDENIVDGGSEGRATTLKYSMEDKWVWDYDENTLAGPTGPTNLPPGGGSVTLPTLPDPLAADPLALPVIEQPGIEYPLADFPKPITVSNPNDPGTSEIFYSVTTGVWSIYEGPITVEPGDTIEVAAVTVDPDRWSDSDIAAATYTVGIVTPELDVQLPTAVNYIEMGGTLVSGAYSPPVPLGPGTVSLINGDDIPPYYEDNAFFQVYWTYDGVDPVSATVREEGAPFAGTFVTQDIPISMSQWPSGGDELVVKVQTESFDVNVLYNSAVYDTTISIDTVPLRDPVIDIDSGQITFTQNPDFGDLPVGTRMYYTTDGTDPGVGPDGEPLSGELYTAPFDLDEDATINVRVYPPIGYEKWFTPSGAVSDSYISPFLREVYIGGRFSLSDGTFRNIAKLGDDGDVDFAFHPGIGASFGSTVGAIIPQPAGRILAGGDFDSMNTTHRYGVVRMNGDGSVDTSFDAALE